MAPLDMSGSAPNPSVQPGILASMDPNAMECDDCGSRFYRSELPQQATFEDKLLVHKQMGCNPIGDAARAR